MWLGRGTLVNSVRRRDFLPYAVLALSFTAVMIWVTGQVKVEFAFSAAGIAFLVSVAVTAFAVRLDTTRPQFAVGGDGELAVGNVSTFVVLFVGFAISVLYGLFGMVGIFLWGLTKTFLILFGVSFLLAVGAVLWLMIGLDKRYERIAQR